jgi:hypothetical protein
MTSDRDMPPLGETGLDRAVALGKGALGTVPVLGSILAEVVTQVIPNQRFERLENYCRRLESRLCDLNINDVGERMRDPERINLFEEGAIQASRATTSERRAYIVNVVATGLNGDQKDAIEARRFLRLLGEIDDDQVIILASYLNKNRQNPEFHETHKGVLDQVFLTFGSGEEEQRRAALQSLSRSELSRLGLLKSHFKNTKTGEIPEFDKDTGMMKSTWKDLSQLGRLLLIHLGLAETDER